MRSPVQSPTAHKPEETDALVEPPGNKPIASKLKSFECPQTVFCRTTSGQAAQVTAVLQGTTSGQVGKQQSGRSTATNSSDLSNMEKAVSPQLKTTATVNILSATGEDPGLCLRPGSQQVTWLGP